MPTITPTVSAIGIGWLDAMTYPASNAAIAKAAKIAATVRVSGRSCHSLASSRDSIFGNVGQYSFKVAPSSVTPEFDRIEASWAISELFV